MIFFNKKGLIMANINKFGGDWTNTKLEILRKYLSAYAKILKNTPFKFAYIDAFAGTGYIKDKSKKKLKNEKLLIEYDKDAQEYLKGSVKIALESEPKYDKYIFIELDDKKVEQLNGVVNEEHKDLVDDIEILNDDANKVIQELCSRNWSKHRAVLFLDPFGMEVKWKTIESIASTKAIDLWILFPLGISVNRMLMKQRDNIPKEWSGDLDKIFGTHEWFNEFYEQKAEKTLFGIDETVNKTANFDKIAKFYIKRLNDIFSDVVDEPMYLYNSTNNPIFLLCFASGNKRGSKTAIKIAKDIIGKNN
jgi:three-Cys-motif partner protein